jgi:hypothetical protein
MFLLSLTIPGELQGIQYKEREKTMKRISILVIGIVALTSVLLVYARNQKSRSVSQPIQPSATKEQRDADERTVATQTRINRHFHSDVIPKLQSCWSKLRGQGMIAIEHTYRRAGNIWVSGKLAISNSTLPKGQEVMALKCMTDSVRGTSFPVQEDEGSSKSFVLKWNWPVPLPANADEVRAMVKNNVGGSGGCDGHGAAPACFTCRDKAIACDKVCVGADSCTIEYQKAGSSCTTGSGICASGGPFGLFGGGIFAQ